MNEPETPLARWSRLKREARKEQASGPAGQGPDQSAQTQAGGVDTGQAAAATLGSAADVPPFDPASLPPIESITAATDVRAFLQAGVPAALTRAALRRVWTTDPAIRDFIEVAENQWDFTDPSAIPGFGAFQPSDNVGELVSRAMGRLGDTLEGASPAADTEATIASPSPASLQRNTPIPQHERPATGVQTSEMLERNRGDEEIAEQSEQVSAPDAAMQDRALPAKPGLAANRRSHGRALPQ